MRRRGRRGFAGQAVVSGLGVVALAGAVLGALFGAGSPARSVSLRDGSLWIQSLTGSLERLDTGSGAIGYRLSTPVAGAPLEIVDDGTTTVLRDPKTGAIRSIDLSAAKAKLSPPSDLAPEARLVSGAGRTFVLFAARGEVAVLDPATLAVGAAVTLGGPLGSAAVDGGGTLWVALPSLGFVVPVSAEGGRPQPGDRAPVGGPATGIDVTVSAGAAYVVDRAAGVLLRLRPGKAEEVARIPSQAIVAEAQGDPVDGHVVVGDPSGAILRIDPRTGRITRFDLPGRDGRRLGPAVQSSNRVAVPDLDTGELVIIDPATGATEARPVRRGGGPVPVVAADGAVVANDPGSRSAVVITPTGHTAVVDKGGVAPGDDEPDLTPTPAIVPSPAVQPQQAGTAPTATATPSVPAGPAPRPAPVAPGAGPPARPISPPGAVQALRAVPGDTVIDLSWTPGQDGGGAVVAVRVECSGAGGPARGLDVPGTATTATVRGLTNGVDHRCTVVARNAAGTGPAATAGPVRPLDNVPGAPTNVKVTSGDARLGVSWSPPGSGGAPAVRYLVTTTSTAGSSTTEVPAAQTTATVTGLVNGTAYAVTVQGIEASGAAGPAGAAAAPATPAGPPGAPQAVVATARSRAIDVRWRPAAPNGSVLTGYVVTADPGGHRKQVGAAGEVASLVGLTNGTQYSVTVVATNAVGTGAPSEPRAATPGAPEINGLSASAGESASLDLTFDVDWKGEEPGTCELIIEGGNTRITPAFRCGTNFHFDGDQYDTPFAIYGVAIYAGGKVRKGPLSVRTKDAPVIHLTRSMNYTPRDWFYGQPEEGTPFELVQTSGIHIYTAPRPGTVALQRFTDGRPHAHWYGRAGQRPPAGYRVEKTLGYVFTDPGPGRPDIRRYVRTDFQGPREGLDCWLPASPESYAEAGPGNWTDDGNVGYGVHT